MRALDYCGMHNATGLRADFGGDPALVFQVLAKDGQGVWNASSWYADKAGLPVRPDDLPAGQSALVRWRTPADWESTGQVPLLLLLVHLNHTAQVADELGTERVPTLLVDDFVAFPALSPYLCCPLTWHTPGFAFRAPTPDAVFDACHDMAYDPYDLVPADVPPHPVP
jgi:hypothetical protein